MRKLIAIAICVTLASFLLRLIPNEKVEVIRKPNTREFELEQVSITEKETVVVPVEKKDKILSAVLYTGTVDNIRRVFPVELTCNTVYDDNTSVVSIKNTDIEIVCDADYSIISVRNRYGSVYPGIYFSKGVPVNALDIYRQLYAKGISGYWSTDYVSGKLVVLKGIDDTKLIYIE